MQLEETVQGLIANNHFFAGHSPVFISRAPGRLDLMGGNDDYAGGLVFESTIREATYAAAQLREDRFVELKNINVSQAGWLGDVLVSLDELYDEEKVRQIVNRSSSVRWTAYVLGNLHYLLRKYPDRVRTGICLYMESSIPFNRGVSSSEACEVAVMKACASAYGIGGGGGEQGIGLSLGGRVFYAGASGAIVA